MIIDVRGLQLSRYIPVPEAGCWLWDGVIGSHGYGVLERNRKKIRAHRFFYEAHKGEIPPGMFVCHKCDTRACVNPDHLFLGTVADNNRDARLKGRHAHGERNGAAKLADVSIDDIQRRIRSDEPVRSIAASYGVSPILIYRIGWGKIRGGSEYRRPRKTGRKQDATGGGHAR
jgi:hypothetical protein